MKTTKNAIFILAICLPALLKAQDSTKHVLPEGTVVSVQLMEDISSSSANAGDIIVFQTSAPVLVGNDTLVRKGTKATGRVTEASPRKGMGKAGKLNFSIDYLNLPTGKNVKLTGEQRVDGQTKVGTAVAEAVLLTPLFLLKKGKDIRFDAGQTFKAFVEHDTAF